MSMHDDVCQYIRQRICEINTDLAISPTMLANECYATYGRTGDEAHVAWASIEHFKQIARQELARQFDPDSDTSSAYQGDMFSGLLQDRYPVPRKQGEEP